MKQNSIIYHIYDIVSRDNVDIKCRYCERDEWLTDTIIGEWGFILIQIQDGCFSSLCLLFVSRAFVFFQLLHITLPPGQVPPELMAAGGIVSAVTRERCRFYLDEKNKEESRSRRLLGLDDDALYTAQNIGEAIFPPSQLYEWEYTTIPRIPLRR